MSCPNIISETISKDSWFSQNSFGRYLRSRAAFSETVRLEKSSSMFSVSGKAGSIGCAKGAPEALLRFLVWACVSAPSGAAFFRGAVLAVRVDFLLVSSPCAGTRAACSSSCEISISVGAAVSGVHAIGGATVSADSLLSSAVDSMSESCAKPEFLSFQHRF